jgi:hypothetical protein
MRAGSRVLATLLAGIVWIFAGYTVASGSLVPKAIAPAMLDAAATCTLRAFYGPPGP